MKNLEHLEKNRIHNPEMEAMMSDDFIGAYTLELTGSRLTFCGVNIDNVPQTEYELEIEIGIKGGV